MIASSSILDVARTAASGRSSAPVLTSTRHETRRRAPCAEARTNSEIDGELLTAHEEERKRVARELHDDLNQRMAMLANEVSTLEHTASPSARLLRKQLRSSNT